MSIINYLYFKVFVIFVSVVECGSFVEVVCCLGISWFRVSE